MKGEKVVKKGVTVRESLWKSFMERVFRNHGQTSGGAIRDSLEEALELWLKQK